MTSDDFMREINRKLAEIADELAQVRKILASVDPVAPQWMKLREAAKKSEDIVRKRLAAQKCSTCSKSLITWDTDNLYCLHCKIMVSHA